MSSLWLWLRCQLQTLTITGALLLTITLTITIIGVNVRCYEFVVNYRVMPSLILVKHALLYVAIEAVHCSCVQMFHSLLFCFRSSQCIALGQGRGVLEGSVFFGFFLKIFSSRHYGFPRAFRGKNNTRSTHMRTGQGREGDSWGSSLLGDMGKEVIVGVQRTR